MSERILFRNVNHRYGRESVLHSVHLSMERGKAVLLAGPNGSGKTTLMRIMAGLMSPESARIAMDDRILTWRQARHLLLDHAVYLHQEPYMFDASVERNIAFALKSKRSAAFRARVGDALDMARLTRQAKQPAKSLSGGERRRLAIARAWLTGADFMLLDEPTANLDSAARAEAIALMRELHHARVGLVISCHMPEEVASFIDETVTLSTPSTQASPTEGRPDAQPKSFP